MKAYLLKLKTEKAKLSVYIVFSLLVILSYILNRIEDGENIGVIIFGIICLFILSVSLTFKSVMYIDKREKQLLTRFYLFGFTIYSQNEILNDVSYIAVVPVVAITSITFTMSTKSFREKHYNLNIVYSKESNKRYQTVESGDYNGVVIIGKQLSEYLQKPICEVQGKDRVWLEE